MIYDCFHNVMCKIHLKADFSELWLIPNTKTLFNNGSSRKEALDHLAEQHQHIFHPRNLKLPDPTWQICRRNVHECVLLLTNSTFCLLEGSCLISSFQSLEMSGNTRTCAQAQPLCDPWLCHSLKYIIFI